METKRLSPVNVPQAFAQLSKGTTEAHTKHQYGITLEEYHKCMRTSDVCEICGRDSKLCYDHDHISNNFRGVLCRGCNIGLGLLGDNIDGLERALNYLKKDEE